MENYLNITTLIIGIVGVILTKIYDLLKLVFTKGKNKAEEEKLIIDLKDDIKELKENYKNLLDTIDTEIDLIKNEKGKYEKEWNDWKYQREKTDEVQNRELNFLKDAYKNILERIEKIQDNHQDNLLRIYTKIEEINKNITILQTLEKERKNGK